MDKVYKMLKMIIFGVIALLAGCTTTGSTLADSIGSKSFEAKAATTAAHKYDDNLIFNILSAEMAAQQGDHQSAYEYYKLAVEQDGSVEIAERGARLSIHSQNIGKAITATREWVKRAPESVDANRVLAALLLRSGDIDSSTEQFKKLIEMEGRSLGVFQLVAEQLRKDPDGKAAEKLLIKIVDSYADIPEAWFVQAWYYSKKRKLEKALISIDQGMKLRGGWGKAIVLRVALLESLGKKDEVLTFLESQVEEYPQDADLFMRYGQALLTQEREAEAVIQFESALELNPNSKKILNALMLVHLSKKQYKHARPYLDQLLEMDGEKDRANYYLGELEEGIGDIDKALYHYASVGEGVVYFNARVRMAALVSADDLARGLSILRGLTPHNVHKRTQLLLLEGGMLEEVKRYADAIEVYDRALKLTPGNEDILYTRAMAGDLAGKLDILERDLHAILEKNPAHYHALNALGYTLTLRTERFIEAEGYLAKALKLRPTDFYVLDSMGWVQYKMGNIDLSLDYLSRALVAKKDVEVAAHLGEVRWVSGDKKGAREIWEVAKKLDPSNPVLVEILKQFNIGSVDE